MLYIVRQIIARLLILIIAISPVQITMAVEIDQHIEAMHCQNSQVPPTNVMHRMGGACEPDQSSHCVVVSVCVTPLNLASLKSSNSFQLLARDATPSLFVPDKDTVPTHYPEPLKRPPKA